MAILPIRKYPDPVLREQTVEVSNFDKELQDLVDSLAETMYQARGIGLAASQVAVLKRVTVIDVSEARNERIDLVNPHIVQRVGKVSSEEGCLSIPGYRDTIKRNKEIVVQMKDASGNEVELKADGLLAICIQHEVDHLEGVLFIDHLSRIKRELFKHWLRKQGPLE
jgi:peptide deformylase